MALSLSENAINAQLASAWAQWCKNKTFNQLQAPTGNPNTPGITLGTPTVTIGSSGGPAEVTVSFPFTPAGVTAPGGKAFAPGTLVFMARLFEQRLEEKQLAQVDGASADRVAQIIDQAGRADGVFSIECLFVDFTTMRNITGMSVPGAASGQQSVVAEVARAVENRLGDKKVLLQTVVCPRVTKRPATFMLKDFAFKVTRSLDPARASTVDYLGVFHGQRAMPDTPRLENALTRLASWLDLTRTTGTPAANGELVAGVMTVRGDLIKAMIVEGLRDALAARYAEMRAENEASRVKKEIKNPAADLVYPEAELFKEMCIDINHKGFEVSENPKFNSYEWPDGREQCKLVKRLRLSCESVPGSGYRINGTISADHSRETRGLPGSTTTSTTTASVTGTMLLASQIARDKDRNPIGANIVPELTLSIGKLEEAYDPAGLTKIISPLFGLMKKILGSAYTRDANDTIRETLIDAVAEVNVRLDRLHFIPPGEEVFTFKSPRFTHKHDLILDVLYRAVLPQAGLAPRTKGGRP